MIVRKIHQPLLQTPGVFKAPAPSTPWYKKWWVWALVVGGTATAGVGGYLIYRRYRGAKP